MKPLIGHTVAVASEIEHEAEELAHHYQTQQTQSGADTDTEAAASMRLLDPLEALWHEDLKQSSHSVLSCMRHVAAIQTRSSSS